MDVECSEVQDILSKKLVHSDHSGMFMIPATVLLLEATSLVKPF